MDKMELKRVEALLKLGRKYGARHLSISKDEVSVSLELAEPAVPIERVLGNIARPAPEEQPVVPVKAEIAGDGMPGDDAMLFYSTPAFDEITAERSDD